MRDCSRWRGPVGMTLGGKLYFDMSDTDAHLNDNKLDQLVGMIERKLATIDLSATMSSKNYHPNPHSPRSSGSGEPALELKRAATKIAALQRGFKSRKHLADETLGDGANKMARIPPQVPRVPKGSSRSHAPMLLPCASDNTDLSAHLALRGRIF